MLAKTAVNFGTLNNPLPNQGNVDPGLGIVISNIITTLSLIGGILLVIYLVYGGVMYVTSGGDKDRVSNAQRIMTNAIIGLIIVAIAAALAQVIGKALGFGNILRPNIPTT